MTNYARPDAQSASQASTACSTHSPTEGSSSGWSSATASPASNRSATTTATTITSSATDAGRWKHLATSASNEPSETSSQRAPTPSPRTTLSSAAPVLPAPKTEPERSRAGRQWPSVFMNDNDGWSLYGAPWLQPVATGRKRETSETARTSRKPLPSVATSCRDERMVRRGRRFESFRGLQKAL